MAWFPRREADQPSFLLHSGSLLNFRPHRRYGQPALHEASYASCRGRGSHRRSGRSPLQKHHSIEPAWLQCLHEHFAVPLRRTPPETALRTAQAMSPSQAITHRTRAAGVDRPRGQCPPCSSVPPESASANASACHWRVVVVRTANGTSLGDGDRGGVERDGEPGEKRRGDRRGSDVRSLGIGAM